MMLIPKRKGKKVSNKSRGDRFEVMVAEEFPKYAPDVLVKRIERQGALQYESVYDLELPQFPHLRVDCKSTIGYWSFAEIKTLVKTCGKKYGGTPIIIYGQRQGKTRISRENIGVAFNHPDLDLVTCTLKDWLVYLNKQVYK